MKKIIACLAAFMCMFTNAFAADIVTDFSQDINNVASQQGVSLMSETGAAASSEYGNGITITSKVSTISTANGTLQLTAVIENPEEGESIIWSIESGSNYATIDQYGLVTAITNGTVVCKARSTVDSTKFAYKTIIISIQTGTSSFSVSLMGVRCSVVRTVDGEEKKLGSYHVMSYPAGTEFTLTAVPSEGNEFLYWVDGSSRIVSYEPTIDFTLTTGMNLTATCAPTDDSMYYITFRNINGKIEGAGYTTSEIKTPSTPAVMGYTFHCWMLDGDMYNFVPRSVLDVSNITKNVIFNAGYIKNDTEYTVTVVGADSEGGKYLYNDLVTLNPVEAEEGKRFAYWMRDGKIVSYDTTYSFYVGAFDTVVEAVFVGVDEAVAQVPIIVMSEPQIVESNKISFVAERNLPEQYTLVSTGIILSNSTSNITLETSGVTVSQATSTDNKGQYTIRKKDVSSSETWFARGYMIYKDGDNLITLYSDPVSKSLNEI